MITFLENRSEPESTSDWCDINTDGTRYTTRPDKSGTDESQRLCCTRTNLTLTNVRNTSSHVTLQHTYEFVRYFIKFFLLIWGHFKKTSHSSISLAAPSEINKFIFQKHLNTSVTITHLFFFQFEHKFQENVKSLNQFIYLFISVLLLASKTWLQFI